MGWDLQPSLYLATVLRVIFIDCCKKFDYLLVAERVLVIFLEIISFMTFFTMVRICFPLSKTILLKKNLS